MHQYDTLDNTAYGSQASNLVQDNTTIEVAIERKPRHVSGKSSIRGLSSEGSLPGRSRTRSKGKRKMITLSNKSNRDKKDEPHSDYTGKVSYA